MLPSELRTDGRDLKRELLQSNEWSTARPEDGLSYVMERCKTVAEETQKVDVTPKPSFASVTADLRSFDLQQLAFVTGIPGLDAQFSYPSCSV